MLFDLYTNYNLVSGKQYKQKLRPQNSQEKGYMQAKIPLPQAIWNEFWLRYCERSEQ